MPFYRFFPILLILGGLVVLTGALRSPSARPSVPDEPVPPAFSGLDWAPADPVSTSLVAEAVGRLEDPRRQWIEASLWLRVRVGDLSFVGEGRYVRGPGRRFRQELHTHVEEPASRTGKQRSCTILSLSDGLNLWTANQIDAKGYTNVTRLRTAAILDGPESPTDVPQLRNEFLAWQAMRGVELFLRSLHGHLDWVRREENRGAVRLIGRWKEWAVNVLAPPKHPWPEALPRYCRLTLRSADQWPARVEWWGPREENGPDRLLVELEFRDPVFDRPLPDDQCARLFAFNPGQAAVEDVTPRVREDLARRAKLLTAPKP